MITGKASCSSLLQANLSSLYKIILERMKDYLGDKLNIEQADGISKRNFARGNTAVGRLLHRGLLWSRPWNGILGYICSS